MAYKDLREWMSRLESKGDLKRVKVPVHWDKEIGAITRKVSLEQGPALLFENISDHQRTFCTKLFANGIGSHGRVAMALGLPENSHYNTLTMHFKEKFNQRVLPKEVATGPVKENVIKGDQMNLYDIPAPVWNPLDGGRYLNTACSVVTMDPMTREVNVGTYRGMIVGKDKIAVLIPFTQHSGSHLVRWNKELGKPMPVAVVYGWDPNLLFASGTPLPRGSEYEVTGALRGEPVELVKCETNGLMVPASAEIVVEGTISLDPSTFEMEGPFGEYTGYYGGPKALAPCIKVDCITHRDDPIYVGTLVGNSPGRPEEVSYFVASAYAALMWETLESAGVPGILDVWATPLVSCTNVRVKIRKQYRGHVQQVANVLWGSGLANHLAKHLIVVDEDIDIHDDAAIDWAYAYRVNAAMNDVTFFPGTFGTVLDPSVPLSMRDVLKYGQGQWTRVLIDATKNWELESEGQLGGGIYPPLCTDIRPEEEKLINARWREYGFE